MSHGYNQVLTVFSLWELRPTIAKVYIFCQPSFNTYQISVKLGEGYMSNKPYFKWIRSQVTSNLTSNKKWEWDLLWPSFYIIKLSVSCNTKDVTKDVRLLSSVVLKAMPARLQSVGGDDECEDLILFLHQTKGCVFLEHC